MRKRYTPVHNKCKPVYQFIEYFYKEDGMLFHNNNIFR